MFTCLLIGHTLYCGVLRRAAKHSSAARALCDRPPHMIMLATLAFYGNSSNRDGQDSNFEVCLMACSGAFEVLWLGVSLESRWGSEGFFTDIVRAHQQPASLELNFWSINLRHCNFKPPLEKSCASGCEPTRVSRWGFSFKWTSFRQRDRHSL